MRALDVRGMIVDRCEACRGIWLDVGEIEKLMAMPSSAAAAFRVSVDAGPSLVERLLHHLKSLKEPARRVRAFGVRSLVAAAGSGGSVAIAITFGQLPERALSFAAPLFAAWLLGLWLLGQLREDPDASSNGNRRSVAAVKVVLALLAFLPAIPPAPMPAVEPPAAEPPPAPPRSACEERVLNLQKLAGQTVEHRAHREQWHARFPPKATCYMQVRLTSPPEPAGCSDACEVLLDCQGLVPATHAIEHCDPHALKVEPAAGRTAVTLEAPGVTFEGPLADAATPDDIAALPRPGPLADASHAWLGKLAPRLSFLSSQPRLEALVAAMDPELALTFIVKHGKTVAMTTEMYPTGCVARGEYSLSQEGRHLVLTLADPGGAENCSAPDPNVPFAKQVTGLTATEIDCWLGSHEVRCKGHCGIKTCNTRLERVTTEVARARTPAMVGGQKPQGEEQ